MVLSMPVFSYLEDRNSHESHTTRRRTRNRSPMTPVVVGAAGVIALVLFTSRGAGMDFDRRALADAYKPVRSTWPKRLRTRRRT